MVCTYVQTIYDPDPEFATLTRDSYRAGWLPK